MAINVDDGGTMVETGLNLVTLTQTVSDLVIVEIKADASYPRPVTSQRVLWIGTVNPLNRIAGDFVFIAAPAPLPDVKLWGDDFTTDGALGNTEVGAKLWQVLGTGYAAARVGGKLKFTAGTTSVGLAVVDSAADGTLNATISTKGANNQAGVVFRGASLLNHLALVRVSSVDAHYRIVKRASGTYTLISALTQTMADGDVIQIVTLGTTVTIRINGVDAYTGTITDYPTATLCGAYCGASTSFAEMAYDSMSFYVPA